MSAYDDVRKQIDQWLSDVREIAFMEPPHLAKLVNEASQELIRRQIEFNAREAFDRERLRYLPKPRLPLRVRHARWVLSRLGR